MKTRLWLPWMAAFAVACGSSSSGAPGDNGGGDTGTADDTAVGGDDTGTTDDVAEVDDNPYPDGPYGTKVGDILADVQLVGYEHFDSSSLANTVDYLPSSLSQVRKDATVPYGMLHILEFW
jgi:hypothetical protein